MCSISLSRGFCSPLFLYLLYHKFPDLSIVFSKKNKNFFYLFGTDCRTSFSCSYFQKLFELPKSGKFRGRATVRGKKRKERLPALFFLYVSCVYSVCSCFRVCECFGVKRFFDYVNIAVKIVSCGVVLCNCFCQCVKIFVLSVSFIKHCARVKVEYSVNDFFHNFFSLFLSLGDFVLSPLDIIIIAHYRHFVNSFFEIFLIFFKKFFPIYCRKMGFFTGKFWLRVFWQKW